MKKRIMIIVVSVAGVVMLLSVTIFFYIRQPKFGKAPGGTYLEQIEKSPNYKEGQFRNIHPTPNFTGGSSPLKIFFRFLFKKSPKTRPVDDIPSVKSDLINLPIDENVLVWFGHSSYFIQLNGKRFLIDPVFSGNASPIPNTNKSFKGSDCYSANDMPEIDFLLITHDHYDHLDYPTVMELKPKIRHIVCGLGVGAHFRFWKFDPEIITEKNWNESISISDHFTLFTTPARHFSGRSLARNNTLWLSFVLQTDSLQLFLGGDGGYDTHFVEIGERFGGFDLALLENGQYNLAWRNIHMLPEEGLKAARDLKTKRLMPIHSSKFRLAQHPWDEPLRTISQLNEENKVNGENEPIPLVTPQIGEIVYLSDTTQIFKKWWEEIN